MAWGINEQLQKTSGADVLLSSKKIRKTLGGVATTPPPPCTSEGWDMPVFFKNITGKQSLTQDKKRTSFFISTIGNKVSMKRPFAKTTAQLQCSKAGHFSPDSGYMILYFQGSVY